MLLNAIVNFHRVFMDVNQQQARSASMCILNKCKRIYNSHFCRNDYRVKLPVLTPFQMVPKISLRQCTKRLPTPMATKPLLAAFGDGVRGRRLFETLKANRDHDVQWMLLLTSILYCIGVYCMGILTFVFLLIGLLRSVERDRRQ